MSIVEIMEKLIKNIESNVLIITSMKNPGKHTCGFRVSEGKILSVRKDLRMDFYRFDCTGNPVTKVDEDKYLWEWQSGVNPARVVVKIKASPKAKITLLVDKKKFAYKIEELRERVQVETRQSGFSLILKYTICEKRSRKQLTFQGKKVFKSCIHTHSYFSDVQIPLSEQIKSMPSSVNLVWWIDHDLGFLSNIVNGGFEDRKFKYHEVFPKTDFGIFRAGATRKEVKEGEYSFYIRGYNPDNEFKELRTRGWLITRALETGIWLRFSLLPDCNLDENARIVVEIEFDYDSKLTKPRKIYYILTDEKTKLPKEYIKLPFRKAKWNDYRVNIAKDFSRIFGNNKRSNMFGLRIGIDSRKNQIVSGFFDNFRLEFKKNADEMYRKQIKVMSGYNHLFSNKVGMEITFYGEGGRNSILPHMVFYYNPRHTKKIFLFKKKPTDEDKARAIKKIHSEEGLAQIHHHGIGFDIIRQAKAWGADILENQYQWGNVAESPEKKPEWKEVSRNEAKKRGYPIDSCLTIYYNLTFWDDLTRRGIYLTGVSSPDLHTSFDLPGPRTCLNRGLTWIYANSDSYDDILMALKCGRCSFGWYDSNVLMALRTPQGFRMGQTVFTDKDSCEVDLVVDNLKPGARISVIEGGIKVDGYTATSKKFNARRVVNTRKDTFIRIEVYNRVGWPIAFSNWLVFIKKCPREWRPGRIALDYRGIILSGVDNILIYDAKVKKETIIIYGTLLGKDGKINLRNWISPPKSDSNMKVSKNNLSFRGQTGEKIKIKTLLPK